MCDFFVCAVAYGAVIIGEKFSAKLFCVILFLIFLCCFFVFCVYNIHANDILVFVCVGFVVKFFILKWQNIAVLRQDGIFFCREKFLPILSQSVKMTFLKWLFGWLLKLCNSFE